MRAASESRRQRERRGQRSPEPGAASVTITGTSSFGMAEVTVPAGETLTVINASTVPHTFTEGENGGRPMAPAWTRPSTAGASVDVTFPEPGDYNVTCLFHSSMNMVVHVE